MKFEVKNGTVCYSETPVVRDANFVVSSGELLAILGPNGAGKTTLLRTAIGLQEWTSGKTLVDDVPLEEFSDRERGRTIAYVPQARNATSLSLTGIDMVTLGRASHLGRFQQPGARERRMAEQTLESIGAQRLGMMQCGAMSGGQYQMILIARALISEPKILVLDEPETGLDFHNQLVVLDLLDRLVRERGLCTIMNTHYPAHAIRLADKVVLIDAEHRIRSGTTSEVITEESLSEAFRAEVDIDVVHRHGNEYPTVTPIRLITEP